MRPARRISSLNAPARSRLSRLSWPAALLVGFLLRVFPIDAARPYIAYVDEGNFLHPVVGMVRGGGWDPGVYLYPQLPGTLVVAAVRLYAPVYRMRHGRDLSDALSGLPEVYDRLEPYAFLRIARAIDVLLGMGAVVLAGLLARRVGGPAAGASAAWLAALAPALVLRAPIATVDSAATLYSTLCLWVTAREPESASPRRLALLAGAAAGGAFASKYPAILVAAAPLATILASRHGWSWAEKARRIALVGAGAVAGVVLAMPAVLLRTRDVIAAILIQRQEYRTNPPGAPLWRQALLRAESNLTYEHPELGAAFVAAAVIGLVLVLRGRETSPVGWGWAIFAVSSLALYGSQEFQPFRNLMPVVPVACASAAVAFARARARLREPRWLDAGALACVLVLWGAPLTVYAWSRAHLVDSRRQAVDWVAAHAGQSTRTLVVRDLGILDTELARLPGRKDVRSWSEMDDAVRDLSPDVVLAGVLQQPTGPAEDAARAAWARSGYALRARFGSRPTVPVAGWWHGNDEIVDVFERRIR